MHQSSTAYNNAQNKSSMHTKKDPNKSGNATKQASTQQEKKSQSKPQQAMTTADGKVKTQHGTMESNYKADQQTVYEDAGIGKDNKEQNDSKTFADFNSSAQQDIQFQIGEDQSSRFRFNQQSDKNINIKDGEANQDEESIDQLLPKPRGHRNQATPNAVQTHNGRETKLSFEPGAAVGGRDPSPKPDRLTDLKLPDANSSREKDGTNEEQNKLSPAEEDGEENGEPGYSLEEKAKLQSVINLFTSNNNPAEQRNKARAQNEKMKMMGEQMMEQDKQINDGAPYEFKKYKKFVVYDKNSLFCFKKGMLFRDKAVQLICWPIFDNFIVLMIFINSLFMACYDYADPENKGENNRVIEYAGHVFTITFSIECFIKIIAMGFCFHKNSYMRDTWNWLDFTVVCVGIFEQIPGVGGSNLKALRTLRVLRPLRSINAFPSMKKLISSLLASLPALANAVVFMLFIFLLFCILGVQSFSGVLYRRCRYKPQPDIDPVTKQYTSWPIVEDIERLCSADGSGQHVCSAGHTCGSPSKYGMSLAADGVPDSELIMYGIITFDNIIEGMITIFQVITLEGWSTLMYNLSDASPQWMSEIFCILLVLVGSFFLLNVILAVIMDAFDEVAAQEEENSRKMKQNLKELKKNYGFEVTDSEEELENEDENDGKVSMTKVADAKQTTESLNQVVPEGIENSQEIEGKEALKQSTRKRRRLHFYPERALKNPIYKFFFVICSDSLFNIFITSCIILNTLLLAMDKYPIQREEQRTQQAMNNILSWIFFGEMVVKLIGLGIKSYASDSFNLFDCAVVVISLVENIIDWLGISFSGGGAISALRAIRLLRVFKLARSWTSFRELLEKIVITLKDITNISVLMLLFMFIFTLVGSEMFAYRVMYNDEDKTRVVKEDGVFPRENFNNLYQGLTTIFIVFIGEDWNSVMYDHYRATGAFTIAYFIFLFIFGNLILLNLFLAILLKNFEEPPGQEDEELEEDEDGRLKKLKIWLMNMCPCMKKKSSTPEGEALVEMVDNNHANPTLKQKAINEANEKLNQDQDDNEVEQMFGEDDTAKKREAISQNSFEKIDPKGIAPLLNSNQNLEETLDRRDKSFMNNTSKMNQDIMMTNQPIYNPNSAVLQKLATENNNSTKSSKKKSTNTFSISQIKQLEVQKSLGTKSKDIELEGQSLILMDKNNKFRIACAGIVGHPNFDHSVLFLIIFSTILLAIEDPFENPDSTKKAVMGQLDIILSIIFLFELLIKVVVYGFAFNGPDSYMRSSWNVMDFIIVFFSMVSIAFADIDLGPIKILRMLRVLRPLRMISRNPGMKIAIQSLINAIPDIGNVMVVSLLFILLFAILATNFYKGRFYRCQTTYVPDEFVDKIKDRFDCLDFGGDWVNDDQNFDDIVASLITLFNVMTTEGWIGVMWNAVDATSINEVPEQDSSPTQILFFMLYMVACSLFVLNMFVGIVINVFNREKEELYMNHKLTQFQRDWCDVLVFCYSQNPIQRYQLTGNQFKDVCYEIATHYMLDNFIFVCITVNTICLSLTWYNEPAELELQLERINLAFNIIYTIESLIKLIAFGQDYFTDGWNTFDFVIVLAAWLGTIANNIDGLELGQSTTIIKSFRILRIFKIIKKYKSLRILFYTFIGAIQQLTNVGGLLFLFLFLYSVLGVFMFAGIKQQEVLNEHANFTGFHSALITLFRMATGESWHALMYDCARRRSIVFDCLESQDYYSVQKYGRQECGNPLAAHAYFISFMLIVSFIFLNLFIAIILESFNTSQNEEGLKITQQTLNSFSEHWSHFDKKAKCFITCSELELLINRMILEEARLLYEARQKVNDGHMEKEEFEKLSIMFNLHKNEYLSGNVHLRQAEYAQEIKRKQNEEEQGADQTGNSVNLSKVVADESGGEAKPQDKEKEDQEEELHMQKETERTLARLMNFFIMSLKIPCYGKIPKKDKSDSQNHCFCQITNFYYYDVLEALARDVFLRWINEEGKDIAEQLRKQNILEEEKEEEEDDLASDDDSQRQKCKYCYEDGENCPLYKKLTEKHKTRYVDCEETDEEMEQEHDFLLGKIDPILGKLERKGQQKDTTINKYQEMSELRAKRNIKSLDSYKLSEYGEFIIDSSQMAAANIIIRFFRQFKEGRAAKKVRALARAKKVAPIMWSQLGSARVSRDQAPKRLNDICSAPQEPIEVASKKLGHIPVSTQNPDKEKVQQLAVNAKPPLKQDKKNSSANHAAGSSGVLAPDKQSRLPQAAEAARDEDTADPELSQAARQLLANTDVGVLNMGRTANPYFQIIMDDHDSLTSPTYNQGNHDGHGYRIDSGKIQFIRDSEPGNKQGEDVE